MRKLVFFTLMLLLPHLANAACSGIYNYQFDTLQGKKLNLCEHQNKVILVVNTASKCGFTPQFEKLEALYGRYKDKGLLVVGFPSNDFKQELQSNQEIGDFCKMTYAVKFPMVTKSSVTGTQANPFYKALIKATNEAPAWNFYKYVIQPNNAGIFVYSSDVEPTSSLMMSKLKPYLK